VTPETLESQANSNHVRPHPITAVCNKK